MSASGCWPCAAAEKMIRTMFQTMAHAMGLYDYHLSDMNEIAAISHAFYDNASAAARVTWRSAS